MKLIKNLATVLLVAFTFATTSAQTAESKKLIVNKWVMDLEAMKPIVMTLMVTNPQFLALDEATKASAIEQTMAQLATLKVEYKADGAMLRNDPSGTVNGTWSLSDDGQELTTKTEGKPDKKYKVLELTKTKISMMSADGRNLILKPE